VERGSRRERVTRLYETGATLDQIGRAENVTRERARQLLEQYDVPKRPRADRLYDAAFPARAEEVEALFLELRDDGAVAQRTGLDQATIRRFVDRNIPDAAVLRRRRKPGAEHYSDDEFITCLRTAAHELPSPMAHSAYAEWSRDRRLDDGRPWPGPQGMMLRFGSWRSALARAGLPANPTAGPDPKFELTDAVNGVVEAWRQTGKPPTVDAYDEWRAGRAEYPASATARKFVDGWDALLLAAWPVVHSRALPGVGRQEVKPATGTPAAGQRGGAPYREADEQPAITPSDPFERDPQELERSVGSHNALQNALARRARERGIEPLSPLALDPEYDLAWRLPDGRFVLVEVKSATPTNLEGQLRLGLGQLLRYGAVLKSRGERVRHMLAVERAPGDPIWTALLSELDVTLVTPDTLEDAFD
jgi:hypothetical protein